MIEAAVRSLLTADATVAALVSDRVYSGVPPQRPTVPYVTLLKVSKTSGVTLDGRAVGPNAIRMQVDCWAEGLDAVRELAAAVNGDDEQKSRGPLHAFAGTVDGMRLNHVRLSVERATEYESDTKLYRVSADYIVEL